MYNVLVPLDIICGKVKLDQRIPIDGLITNDKLSKLVWIIVGLSPTSLVVEMFHQRWDEVLFWPHETGATDMVLKLKMLT